ncbi:putative cytokinetic ring protein SteA [Paenibacillus ginsengarvi]|uniref:Thiamine pyrophosphokinase n=1 Tax=Paenibacillus ginsengarvi TaxID=400777 RepID=A0A3B0CI14_9BACL|nr:putative cytokinetic ring protein SteA [Paenibacillus ginsengarvi]RKN84680.1 thiamine pyrophosphokinase [Paenibacillus ginsengarvi]
MRINNVRAAAVMEGVVRADRNTKRLLRHIRRGEIALICHDDLDEPAAEGLLRSGVKAVINSGRTMTSAFPHDGPLLLLREGIPIYEIDESSFELLQDGERIRIRDGTLTGLHAELVCYPFGYEEWERLKRTGERMYPLTLLGFAENTLHYAANELNSLTRPLTLPELNNPLETRDVLVVSRGSGCREDLAALRHYIRSAKPVLVGVDGGADVLVSQGYVPDLIIGDMDSVSDQTLRVGAQLLVHAYPDGWAPGLERIRQLGLASDTVAAPGTSEDLALRLSYEQGAARIVIVGSHSEPIDFLKKGRAGMASTLLVRMLVGHKLIDAKGASLWGSKKSQLHKFAAIVEGGALWRTSPYR